MKFHLVAVATMVLLSACAGQVGGEGQLSNGEPLSVLMNVDPAAGSSAIQLDIASPRGWSCQSTLTNNNIGGPVAVRRSFPMTCSDGATGTVLVTWDNIHKRQQGAFTLSNGRAGSFLFDFKP